jgi:hypothetical protein
MMLTMVAGREQRASRIADDDDVKFKSVETTTFNAEKLTKSERSETTQDSIESEQDKRKQASHREYSADHLPPIPLASLSSR